MRPGIQSGAFFLLKWIARMNGHAEALISRKSYREFTLHFGI